MNVVSINICYTSSMFFTHILNNRRIPTSNHRFTSMFYQSQPPAEAHCVSKLHFFSTFVFGYFLFCYVFGDKNNIYLKIITQILTGALWVAAMVYGTTAIVKGIFVRSYFCFCKHWTNPTTQTAQQRNKIVWRTPMTTAPQPRTTDANMSNEEWWEGRDCGAPATNHPRKYE